MKLLRKLFHILSGTFIIIAIILFHHNYRLYIIIGLGIISLIGLLVDFFRITFQYFNELLTKKLLSIIFYKNEEKGINSATFFFFSASFITFLICLFGLSIWKALIISIILTLIEIVSLKVDDNLSIPIVAGFLFMTIGRL
jgi:dolichol kinase